MPWIQTYTPAAGSLGLSALIAAIPLVVIFVCLAVLKMKAHKAGPLAVAEFEKRFSKKDYSDAGELSVPTGIWIVELVEKTGQFKSRSEIRRLIQQGGVTLDGAKITDDNERVTLHTGQILKAGKLVVVKLLESH